MRRLGIAVATLLVVAGCGGSAAGVGQAAAGRLGPEVDQVKAAITRQDQPAAAAGLAGLRATVADLRQRNQLSDAAAARVLGAVADVEARLGTPTSAPVPQTSTTTPPAQIAPAGTTRPHAPAGGDKGKGDGKGKGD